MKMILLPQSKKANNRVFLVLGIFLLLCVAIFLSKGLILNETQESEEIQQEEPINNLSKKIKDNNLIDSDSYEGIVTWSIASKEYIGDFVDVKIARINETYSIFYFNLEDSFKEEISKCEKDTSKNKGDCLKDIKDLNSSKSSNDVEKDLKKLDFYPVKYKSENVYLDKEEIDLTKGEVELHVYSSGEIGEVLDIGFGTISFITVLTGSASEILIYTGSADIDRDLVIPLDSYVSSASMTIAGTANQYLRQINAFDGDVGGLANNGTHLFQSDRDDYKIEWGTIGGTDLGMLCSHGVTYPLGDIYGIDTDGTYIWGADTYHEQIVQFDYSCNVISNFSTIDLYGDAFPQAYGVAIDGDYLWITDSSNGASYKVWKNGTYTGISQSEPASSVHGLDMNGTYIWETTYDGRTVEIFKYADWSSVGSFAIHEQTSWRPGSITYNDTTLFVGSDGGNDIGFYEMTPPFNYPSNPSLTVDLVEVWTSATDYSSSGSTGDFASTLNLALNNGACDCDGCSDDGTDCTIPFTFHSDDKGYLTYSSVSVGYEPFLTIVSPANESEFSPGELINMNVSAGVAMDVCYWNDGTTNYTMTERDDEYFYHLNDTLAVDDYVIKYWCQDDANSEWHVTDDIHFVISSYAVSILDPTAGSPLAGAAEDDNTTITFLYLSGGVNSTTDVTVESVWVGDTEATIITSLQDTSAIKEDTFVEAGVDVVLVDHTPTGTNAGTGWTEDAATGGGDATVESSTNNLRFSADDYNDYLIYTFDDVPGESEYNITITLTTVVSSDDLAYLLGRYTDTTHGYQVTFSSTASECKLRYQNGGATQTLDTTLTGVANGDVIVFEITDAAKNVWKNGVIWMTSADNTITATGKAGLGCGDLFGDAGEDCRTGWRLDDFNISYGGEAEFPELAWNAGTGWELNVTLPAGTGAEDLYMNATWSGNTKDDTEVGAIVYEEIVYELNITDPNTADPESVSSDDNISILFNFLANGANVTSGVTINNVTIGGTEATILETSVCEGTLDCTNYVAEAACDNCSQCSWSAGASTENLSGSTNLVSIQNGYYANQYMVGQSITAQLSGDVTKASIYFNTVNSAQDCKVGIYDQSNNFVGNSSEASVSATGWKNFTFDAGTTVTATTVYDLVVWCGGATGQTYTGYVATTGTWQQDGYAYGAFPDPGALNAGTERLHAMYFIVEEAGANVCDAIDGGACSSCSIGECDTNCSSAGCSIGSTPQFSYITDVGWQVNVTVPDFASGLKDLFVNATYSGSTRNDTESNAISYGVSDSTPPYFTLIPANASISYGNETLGVDFNATDETAFDTFAVNDSRFAINDSGWLSNNSILAVGVYELNISINDTAGNTNSTAYKVTINQNTYACDVFFNETSPLTYLNTFLAWTDCNSAFTFYRNGTVISNNSVQSLGAGTYNFSVQRTDTSNYSNTYNEELFTIDKAVPTGSLTNSTLWNIDQGTEITIGLSESNTGDGDLTYIVYRDGVSKGTGETWTPDTGTYDYVLNTTGGANYTANASMDVQTLTVNDVNPPSVTMNSPLNNVYSDSVLFNVTATDITGMDSCWYSLDGGTNNVTMTNISSEWTDINSSMSQGSQTVNFYCNDTLNNLNDTEQITFFVDTLAPNLTIISPLNDTYDTVEIIFNVTAIDPDSDISSCLFSLDGGNNITLTREGESSTEGNETGSFDLNDTNLKGWGITTNGTYLWVTDYESDGVYKYYTNGTYVDFFDTAGVGNANPFGIYTNNTYIWITDYSDDLVYKYYMNGTDTGETFSTASEGDAPHGITMAGDFFWITQNENAKVFKYWINGTYTGEFFDTSNEINLFTLDDIDYDGKYFYVGAGNPDKVYKYYLNGMYTGFSFSTSSDALGLTHNATTFWVVDNDLDKIYTYERDLYTDEYSYTNSSMTEGSHNVTYFCNDTSGNLNITDAVYFEISIVDATPPYFITIPADDSIVYGTSWNGVYFNATDEKGFDTYVVNDTTNFQINSTGFLNWTGQLAVGDYYVNVTINDTSNNLNSTIYNLNITQAIPSGSLSGSSPITYGTAGDVQGSESNSGDGDVVYKLYREGVEVSDPDTDVLGVGVYNYIYNTTGGANYTANASLDTFELTVNQDVPTGSLQSSEGWTLTYPTETIISLSESNTGDGDVTYVIYRDGISKGTGETITLGYGTYDYVLNTTGGTNYTENSSMDVQTLTINKDAGACDVLFNETSPLDYLSQFQVYSNCDSTFTLYRNGTEVSNNSVQSLGVGTYNFSVQRTDTENYTNIYDEELFTINQASSLVYTYLNNSRSNITIYDGDSIWLNGTLETGEGEIKLYNNGSLINSGAGPLSNLTTFSGIGIYNITTIYEETQNYTSIFETFWVNVTEIPDAIPPTITIVYPANNTNSTDYGLDVNFTVSDDVAVDSCWWSDDGGAFNVSNPSCENMTDIGGWVEGVNVVWVWVNDTSGNEDRDEVTFRIDTNPPYFTSIVDQTINETDTLSYTPTADDDGVGLDSWAINATEMITINSITGEITNTSILSSGYYSYNVSINDTLGNTNSTIWNLNVTSVDSQNPSVSGLTESPVDGSEYFPGQSYKFNATVTDDNLDTVVIEFDGVNYSTSNTGSVYNFTIIDLAVGSYSYTWFANDTFGNANNSESGTYDVVQNSSYVISIDLSPSDTEDYGVETTATGNGCPSQLTCNLYKNDSSVSNPDVQTLPAGIYNYTFNTTGNSNYSSSSVSDLLTIGKLSSQTNLTFDKTSPQDYGTEIIPNCSIITGEGSAVLEMDGGVITSGVGITLGAGIYSFNCSLAESTNYSYSENVSSFTISQISSEVYTYLNNSRSNESIYSGTSIWLNGTLQTGEGDISLYNNGTLINSGSGPLENLTAFSVVGMHNITTIYPETQNYTSSFETWWVNVTEAPDITYPQFYNYNQDPINNTPYAPATTAELGVYVNFTNGTVGIEFEGVNYTTTNVSNYFYHVFGGLSAGTYNYYFWAYGNGTQNNFNVSESQSYTIAKETGNGTLYLNNSANNLTIYSGDSIWINGTLDTGSGAIQIYVNNTLWNSGTSPLSNYSQFNDVGYIPVNLTYAGNENYTSFEKILYLNVTEALDTTPPYFTNIPANASIDYGQGWAGVDFDADDETGFGSFFIDDTTNFTINTTGYLDNNTFLFVGIYLINVSINDTSGNINSTLYQVTVNKATPNVTITWTNPITYGTPSDAQGIEYNEGDGDVVYSFYRSVADADIWVSISNPDTAVLSAGMWDYKFNTTEGENYSSLSLTMGALTVDQAVPTGSLNSNATWTIAPGNSVEINFSETNTGDADVNYTVYRNGTYIGSGETWSPATGVYTYVLNTTGGTNYSANANIDTQVLTVTSAGIPSINFTNGTEENNSFVQRDWIFVNVSVTIIAEDTIIFNLYNLSHDNVNSSSFDDSTRTINWTNLTDGQYYYNVTINNTGGGENSTETRLITLDNEYGNLSIIIPIEGASYGNVVTSINVDVNYSVNETNLDSCWYRLRGVQTIDNTTTPCSNGYNNFTMTISNFGYLTLDVYSNDSASNEEYDLVNFYVNQYTGPQQGGGTNTDPTDNDEEDVANNYNVSILCAEVNKFLNQYGNYTYEEKEDLRNSLAIIFGFAIDGQLLNKYLTDYDSYCPDEEVIIPDEPDVPEKKKVNYWMFVICILSILILILILMIIYHRDRLILILNRLRNDDEEKKKHS